MKTFDPDDPMLTAYALGELEGEELREIEELVARDPAAARHVESIRSAASGFCEAFEREPAPRVEPIRPVEIEPKRSPALIPWLFYASTAAAACFFVVLVIRMSDPRMDGEPADLAAEVPVSEEQAAQLKDEAASSAMERRRAEVLRKEGRVMTDSFGTASSSGPAAARVAEGSSTRESADSDKRSHAPPPSAVPATGEMKNQAKSIAVQELDNKDDVVELEGFVAASGRRSDSGALDSLSSSVAAGKLPPGIDTAALLGELGLGALAGNEEPQRGNMAQTTSSVSPQPDPEAALVRAVEGFARLVEARTPAADADWDRVLRDARHAAGDDPKRLAFVQLVEATRREIGKSAR